MKDFSKWLEAWKNYPPIPDWLTNLGTIAFSVILVLMSVGIIVGLIGTFLRDSCLPARIIVSSLVSGACGCISFNMRQLSRLQLLRGTFDGTPHHS